MKRKKENIEKLRKDLEAKGISVEDKPITTDTLLAISEINSSSNRRSAFLSNAVNCVVE